MEYSIEYIVLKAEKEEELERQIAQAQSRTEDCVIVAISKKLVMRNGGFEFVSGEVRLAVIHTD